MSTCQGSDEQQGQPNQTHVHKDYGCSWVSKGNKNQEELASENHSSWKGETWGYLHLFHGLPPSDSGLSSGD